MWPQLFKTSLKEDFFHVKMTPKTRILKMLYLKIWPLKEEFCQNIYPKYLTGFLDKYPISWKYLFLILFKTWSQIPWSEKQTNKQTKTKQNLIPCFLGQACLQFHTWLSFLPRNQIWHCKNLCSCERKTLTSSPGTSYYVVSC